MTTKGTKHGQGLGKKIERYFAENPHEELSYGDIAVKFGVSLKAAYRTVSALICKGMTLETIKVIRVKGKS